MDTPLGTTGLALHDDKFPLIYRGKVLDNNDPSQYGRIKVQIYPMFTGITDATLLPWAVPANPLWEGAGAGIGYFAVPDVGSFVFVFFEQGDHYQPVYFAEAPTATMGLPSDRVTNYPNRKVVKSSSGVTFIVDDTAKTIRINHPASGVPSLGIWLSDTTYVTGNVADYDGSSWISLQDNNLGHTPAVGVWWAFLAAQTYVLFDADGNITLDPNLTHRVIVNAFSRTLKTKLISCPLIGDDGGMIFFIGALTFTLPSCLDYPGLEYIFKRMDAGVTPATVVGAAGPTQIEPNPLPFRLITGLYAKLHLISGGSETGMWHEI